PRRARQSSPPPPAHAFFARSLMVARWYFDAVAWVTAKALVSTAGAGLRTVMFFALSSDLRWLMLLLMSPLAIPALWSTNSRALAAYSTSMSNWPDCRPGSRVWRV